MDGEGHLVTVTVKKVRKSGLEVEVTNTREKGFIPRREFDWDRRVKVKKPKFKQGQTIEVVLVKEEERGKRYYSVKRTFDPWTENIGGYREGQHVRGEVVNVRHFGAFVQLEPGIVGLLWPRDIPLFKGQAISDVLSVGDEVMAEIILLDPDAGELELSITNYLAWLDENQEKRVDIQLDIFERALDHCASPEKESGKVAAPSTGGEEGIYREPIPFPEHILIVDDDVEEQKRVAAALRQACQRPARKAEAEGRLSSLSVAKTKIHSATDSDEALALIQNGHPFGFALVDCNLPRESGVEIARRLWKAIPGLPVIFTSNDPSCEEVIEEQLGAGFIFSDKSPHSIAAWFQQMASGYFQERAKIPEMEKMSTDSFLRHLDMQAFAAGSLPERLGSLLDELVRKAGVKYAFILEMEPVRQRIRFLARGGAPLAAGLEDRMGTELYFSPVREVIEEEIVFYEVSIDQADDRRLQYLFRWLDFNLAYGTPLIIPNVPVSHALFVLDNKKQGETFDMEALRDIRSFLPYLQVTLERSILLDYMRRYEKRYFLGELSSSLVHELRVKLNGLKWKQATLSSRLAKAEEQAGSEAGSEYLGKALQASSELEQMQQDLEELLDSYSRLAKAEWEETNLSHVAAKICRQFQASASEVNVALHPILEDGLPPVLAIPSRVEEIVGNVLLNALQQIAAQAQKWKKLHAEKPSLPAFLQRGEVIVQSRFCPGSNACQVIILDTGPGISYQDRSRIFQLGVSSRKEGYGLGLYISKNLVELMGGRLYLLGSILFVGSLFILEFPTDQSKKP